MREAGGVLGRGGRCIERKKEKMIIKKKIEINNLGKKKKKPTKEEEERTRPSVAQGTAAPGAAPSPAPLLGVRARRFVAAPRPVALFAAGRGSGAGHGRSDAAR